MKIFLLFLSVILAWVQAEECNHDGHKFKVGETYAPIGHCNQYTCQNDGIITALTCPAFPKPKECEIIPQDNTKPYPECCPRLKC